MKPVAPTSAASAVITSHLKPFFAQSRTQIVLAAALLLHVVLLSPIPLIWKGGALLLLCGFGPGWLLVEWMVNGRPPKQGAHGAQGKRAGKDARSALSGQSCTDVDSRLTIYGALEQVLFSVAVGYGVIIWGMLLLSYLPGPIPFWLPLLAFDLLLLLLLVMRYRQSRLRRGLSLRRIAWTTTSPKWLAAALISLALVGGFMRFPNLAYAEFQGDEARVMLRAVQAIQGDPNALLGHLKAPAEILLPTLIYAVTGQIDEATARLPFALANFAALFGLFLLGRRLFGPLAGWAAAMLLALDGYFIGFAHIVQYQSIVFLCVAAAVLIMARVRRLAMGVNFADDPAPAHLHNLLMLTAFVAATGLLAHYEAALVAIPLLYLLLTIWREGAPLSSLLRLLMLPLALGAAMVLSFYLPFVLNPSFGVTYSYITVNRLGVEEAASRYPFNNLADVVDRTTLYSSSYYLALLGALTLAALMLGLRRAQNYTNRATWRRTVAQIGAVLLLLGILHLLIFGATDPTWLLFAAVLLVGILTPLAPREERLVWLWFGIPMILALFFIRTPNTHVYGFFIGWALLAGWAVDQLWRGAAGRMGTGRAAATGVLLAAGLIALFGFYEYSYFVRTDVEMLRTWSAHRLAGYPVPYAEPTNLSIFGFPFRNGWKSVAMLYETGVLNGAFDTNATDAVAQWYTRGRLYCPRDQRYFIWSPALEPKEAPDRAARQAELAQTHDLLGVISVAGEPRLHIFQAKEGAAPPPQSWTDAELAAHFDQTLAAPDFAASGESGLAAVRKRIQNPRDFTFGGPPDAAPIALLGYDLSSAQPEPGARVMLTLYWQARQPVAQDYVVFNQIIDLSDGHKAGQRDGEPVCNTLPTTRWQPGRVIVDRYDIPIAPDAPARPYTLLMGLYGRDSGERVPIFDASGQALGEAVQLGEMGVGD
ncbi:MAG: glycosyltransferase family 39 protein [Caldilineaceae bacterium]